MIDTTKFRRAASNWTRQTRTHEPRNPRRARGGSEPDAATETARAALQRLSNKIRAARATGQLPPALADCETINDCLRRIYQIQSRQTDFDTFSGWRARGYGVDKGARGWPIWSRPKGRRDAETPEAGAPETGDAEAATEPERKSFWVAYLFHAGQVHNRATQARPATYRAAELPALPLPADYAADLNEIRDAGEPQPAPAENNPRPAAAIDADFKILEDVNPAPQPAARAQSAGKTAARALEALYKAKSSDKFRPQLKYPYCDAAAGEIFASDGIRLVRVNSAAIPELAQLPSGFFDIIKDGRKHKIGLAGPDAAENPVNFRGAIPDFKNYSRIEIGARNPDGGKKKADELANEVNAILLRDFDTLVNLKFIKDAIGSAPQDFTLYAPPDNRQPVALEDKTGALLSVIMPIYNPKK